MRPMLRPILVIAGIAGAAGCAIPEKQLVAQGAPFACYNQAPPTTAPKQITITGTVNGAVAGSTISGASIEAFLADDPTKTLINSATSGGDGGFVMQQGTGGFARNAYLKVTQNGYLDTYYYPAVSIAGDVDVQVQLLTMADAAKLASLMGIAQLDLTKDLFLISVVDCNDHAIGGATVSTEPMGAAVHYFTDSPGPTPSSTAIATDSVIGTAVAANVPVSNTSIQATVPSPTDPSMILTLHSHSIDAMSGVVIQTEIQP